MESELAEIKALLAKVLSNQEALLKSPENALNGLKPELEKKVTKRKTKWQTYDEQTKIDKTIARMVKARTLLDEYIRKLLPEDNKLELKQKIEKALRSELINREQFDNFSNIRLLGNQAAHEPKKMNPGDKKVQHQVNVYYNYIWTVILQSEVFRKDAFLNPKKKEQSDQEQEEKKQQKKPKEPKEKKEQIEEKVPKDEKKLKEQKEDLEEKKEPKEQKKPKEKTEQDGQKPPKEPKEKKEPGEPKEKKEKKEKEKKEQDGQKEQKPKKLKEQKE